jgi:RND superfamily putative drug exporter
MIRIPSTQSLARWSAWHPWRVIGAWVIILLVAVVLGLPNLSSVLETEVRQENNPESIAGETVIDDAGLGFSAPQTEMIVISAADGLTVDDPGFQAVVQAVTDDARSLLASWDAEEAAALSWANTYELAAMGDPGAAALVSADRTTTIIPVAYTDRMFDAFEIDAFEEMVQGHATDTISVGTVGALSIDMTFSHASEEDIVRGEAIGIPIAIVILALVFGAIVAPVLPLLIGLAAVAISLGIVAAIGQFAPQQIFISNIITGLGLAVGIDYALFIVDRYREARAQGKAQRDAIEAAGATASKAVVFSAATVMFSLAGLWLVPNNIFQSFGLGAVVVVAVTVVATLTLLPAMMGLLGDRINWPRKGPMAHMDSASASEDDAYTGFWGRVTRTVMARPIISVVLATAVLIGLASPVLDMNTGFGSGADSLPPSATRDTVQILESKFPAGLISPVRVVIQGEPAAVASEVERVSAIIQGDSRFSPQLQPTLLSTDGGTAVITAMLAIDVNSDAAYDTIDWLRNDVVEGSANVETWVTGESAENRDMISTLTARTPWVFGFVLVLTLVLLTMVFRSVFVPIKAVILNLLSVGAAYGLMVAVFQHGFLIDLFGFQRAPAIDFWIPLFMFSVLFGLSMDYHVFLLSRIREHFDQTGRNRESVAVGLRTTARIITGAALIMVAVFGGMASGQVISMQQMGFGLGVAVLLDATIVRSVLVPASMALLGKWNWYMPSWMGWVPDLRIEGEATPRHAPPSAPSVASAD